MFDRGWSFEFWFLWILLVGGVIFYSCYNAEACEKMRCPAGTKPRYFVSTYNSSCVCEPTGWRK